MTDRDEMLNRVMNANPVPGSSQLPPDLADSRPPIALLLDHEALIDGRPKSRTGLPWRGFAVAAAAALLLFAVIAVPLLLSTRRAPGPVTDTTVAPPVSTTIPAATTAPPPPTTVAPAAPETWPRVGTDVMDSAVGLVEIAPAGTGFIAAGFDPGDDFRQDGVIFVSEDGTSWERLAADDPALTTGTVLIHSITEGGPGLVAVGMSCADDAFPCEFGPYPTVWTSAVGSEWTRTSHDPELFGDIGSMESVVVTDHGIVAAGWFNEPAGGAFADTFPAVWLSANGAEWSRVWEGDPVRTEGFPPSAGVITRMAASPDGVIVATGTALGDHGQRMGAMWISSDGHTWDRIESGAESFGDETVSMYILDIAWSPSGFVAVGTEGGTVPAVWHSPDGDSWSRIEAPGLPDGTTAWLSSVASLEGGFVAAGPSSFGAGEEPGQILTSPDGLRWNRVATVDSAYVESISATDAGIVAAGAVLDADEFRAAVWLGPTIDPNDPQGDPLPPAAPESAEPRTDIQRVRAELSCEELAQLGYTYAESVSYWVYHDTPVELDSDGDGLPCESAFSASDFATVYGPSEAVAVHIVSHLPDDSEGRIFEATGPAVDAGIICPTGTTEWFAGAETTHPRALFRWEDRFTCADGSGTFILGSDVFIEARGREHGVWSISSGTGAYEGLTGGGSTDTGPDASGVGSDDLVGRLTTPTSDT